MPLSTNLKAASYMTLAMSGFVINDVIVKTLTGQINTGQIMFVRGLIMTVVLAGIMLAMRHKVVVSHLTNGPMIARVILESVATIFFIIGFANLPVSNAAAIMQALPLAVTVGAALFLKEQVGWRRISAILAGLIGVLIIIRPGVDGFNIFSLCMLAVVVLAAARDLVTRIMNKEISSTLVSTVTSAAVTVLGAALIGPFGGWQSMDWVVIGKLVLAAGFLFLGYQFIVLAMREGEVATVAPFRYTALLWAIILGYFVFDDLPDFWTFIGSLIVVGSGLYAIMREHQRNRSQRLASQSAASVPPARGA